MSKAKFRLAVQFQELDGRTQVLQLHGRDAWAMEQLIKAGPTGCTPITHPGPRWSGYVHKLRRCGIKVLTVTELHDGLFPGHHAQYVLDMSVTVLSDD